MYKSISKLFFSVIFVTSIALTTVSSPVKADDTVSNLSAENTSGNYTIPDKFRSIDKFVKVKENKFVLNVPQGQKIDEKVIKEANKQLSIANRAVEEQNLIIDPQTKMASNFIGSSSPFIVLAKLPANQNMAYAWGVRSIFRSNAAVRTRVNIYYNVFFGALAVQDVSGSAGMAGFPWQALIGTVSSSVVSDRTKTWADRLDSYNKKHKKNKIYQDINWALQDSEGVWHD